MPQIQETQDSADFMLTAHVPFGCSSGPRWYPSIGQRARYFSGSKRWEEWKIPVNNMHYFVNEPVCMSGVCILQLHDGKNTHPLLCWGRYHRGLPSLDQAFQCSSILPLTCSEALELGSAHFQTWYSSSSRGYLRDDTHTGNKCSEQSQWSEFM